MTDAPTVATMTLEITHRCHRRCRFCYLPRPSRAERARRRPELSATTLVDIAQRLRQHSGCEHVQLSGGEPLLRDDLLDVVSALRERGMQVSMLTDGGPLSPATARALADQGLALMQPTLLAGRAPLHDSLRGPGAFAQTTRAIAVAAAAGLRVTVSLVLTAANWDQAPAVAELCFALGARGLTLCRFCPVGPASAAAAELLPSAVQVREAAQRAAVACRDLGLSLSAAITIPRCVWQHDERPPLRVGVCALMGARIPVTIGPDGAVRSCSLSGRPVGSALRDDWPQLLQRLSEQHLEPARQRRPAPCRACDRWDGCFGGCRLSGLSVGQDFGDPDPLAPAPLSSQRRE